MRIYSEFLLEKRKINIYGKKYRHDTLMDVDKYVIDHLKASIFINSVFNVWHGWINWIKTDGQTKNITSVCVFYFSCFLFMIVWKLSKQCWQKFSTLTITKHFCLIMRNNADHIIMNTSSSNNKNMKQLMTLKLNEINN